MPEYITVDVSAMELNDVLHLKDIKLPNGVKTKVPAETSLVAVHIPKEQSDVAAVETIDPETGLPVAAGAVPAAAAAAPAADGKAAPAAAGAAAPAKDGKAAPAAAPAAAAAAPKKADAKKK